MEKMKRITHWKAKRAGARITIYGKVEGGDDIRIANVDVIEVVMTGVRATDKDGVQYALMPLNALQDA